VSDVRCVTFKLEEEGLYLTTGLEVSSYLGWNSYYFPIASANVFSHLLPIC